MICTGEDVADPGEVAFVSRGWSIGFFEALGVFRDEVAEVDGQVVCDEPGFGRILGFAGATMGFFVWWQLFFKAFDDPVKEVLAVDGCVVDYGVVF